MEVYRLREVLIKAGGSGGLFVILLPPPGERDQDRIAAPGFEAHAPSDFMTAHVRHADVDNRGTGSIARCYLKRSEPIEGNRHIVPGEAENHGERFGGIAIVVDDEYACAYCITAVANDVHGVGEHVR